MALGDSAIGVDKYILLWTVGILSHLSVFDIAVLGMCLPLATLEFIVFPPVCNFLI